MRCFLRGGDRCGVSLLPGGHQEGWADALLNVFRDNYAQVVEAKPATAAVSPVVATFEDGYRANCIVDAMLASHAAGSVWTKVKN